ncbi:enoyl-CoA hydratase/isomerase [Xylaria sp. CBS 124048]|nr:enoyl-CoA hydratase/isomerase [Xylaria sp. CBS 124048]
MAAEKLFSVPVPTIPSHPGGSIVCTTPSPRVYVLTFTSPNDNRLTPDFCHALITALDIIEFGYEPGVVVTTSGIKKFYSNGLDLDLALSTPGFWEDYLYPLYRRLLTYPMPTIAMINGHAFAGGFILAMHHDYRVFTSGGRGYACVNELEFGAALPPPMSAIFRVKTTPSVYRTLVLEAKRFDASAALESGLVDAVGEMDTVLKLIENQKLIDKPAAGVYGWLKAEMYSEVIDMLDVKNPSPTTQADIARMGKKRKAEGQAWLKKWKDSQSRNLKAKL